jgi:HEAT repeat protein
MAINLHDVFSLLMVFLAALLVAVLGLFAFLVLQRAAVNILAKQARRRETALMPLLHAALTKPSAVQVLVRTVRRTDRSVIRDMILRLALDLRGDEAETLVGLYRTLGFLECDLTGLRARRWMRRAAAAARLGTLRRPEALRWLRSALADPAVGVRLAAVRAVGETGDHAALTALVSLLGDGSPGVARAAVEVLSLRGREVIEPILAFLRDATTSAARQAAVDVLGFLRAPQATSVLLDLMKEPDVELRIKVVKAAAAIGDPRFKGIFECLMKDPHWEIRCFASKGLSLLGSPESVPCLRQALEDSHSWVRFYAGLALVEMGTVGRNALLNAVAKGRPPARDIALYLLERAEAVPVVS